MATCSPAPEEAVAVSIGALDAGQQHAALFRPVDFAAGEADGLRCRAEHGRPSKYLLVGRDNYAAGFRAGYFRVAAPRTAGAALPAGMPLRDRLAATLPGDPTPRRRHGSGAAPRENACRRTACDMIHGSGCRLVTEGHSMIHEPTAAGATRASAEQDPPPCIDRCIDRSAPCATRLALAQAIGSAAGSGGRAAVMRVRICPAVGARVDETEWTRLVTALAGRIACSTDDWGPLPDGAWGFAVVLGAVADRLSALTRANRMVATLDQPMRPDACHPAFAAAVGIGLFPEDGADAEEILDSAAHALVDLCRSRQGAVGFRFRRAAAESAHRGLAIPDAPAPAAWGP